MGTTLVDERYQTLKKLHEAEGGLDYSLHVFGDALAKREGYKNLDGIEAIHFYLIEKHSWLPRDVRSMSNEDLRFVLCQEMEGWVLPLEAR
jgi:hypothetical protein